MLPIWQGSLPPIPPFPLSVSPLILRPSRALMPFWQRSRCRLAFRLPPWPSENQGPIMPAFLRQKSWEFQTLKSRKSSSPLKKRWLTRWIKRPAPLPDPGKIIRIDPVTPEPKAIAGAGSIIQKGGVVIFPTQCLYGIAADALNEKAVEKVFNIKKRPTKNPILVLVPDQSFLEDLAESIPEPARKLMKAFWPGGLTLVCRAKPTVPKCLTAGSGKLGIRIPCHPAAKALVNFLGFPITGTSANLSGKPGCDRISSLDPSILENSDLILDAGILKGGIGSTIVDVTASPVHILREGMISENQIRRILT